MPDEFGCQPEASIVLLGVTFESGTANLSPEAEARLNTVAPILLQYPGIRFEVGGHTDSVGKFDSNMTLSIARAGAVVDVLVKEYGIDSGRLKAHGVGPLVPTSTNRSADGRAVNRRVELVEQ